MTAGEAILALLANCAEGATICPSEAARLMAGPQGDWRAEIEAVHAATDALAEAGMLRLSWKGADTQKRRGPDRIARRRCVTEGRPKAARGLSSGASRPQRSS